MVIGFAIPRPHRGHDVGKHLGVVFAAVVATPTHHFHQQQGEHYGTGHPAPWSPPEGRIAIFLPDDDGGRNADFRRRRGRHGGRYDRSGGSRNDRRRCPWLRTNGRGYLRRRWRRCCTNRRSQRLPGHGRLAGRRYRFRCRHDGLVPGTGRLLGLWLCNASPGMFARLRRRSFRCGRRRSLRIGLRLGVLRHRTGEVVQLGRRLLAERGRRECGAHARQPGAPGDACALP